MIPSSYESSIPIITANLVMYVDASITESYIGSGTVVNDISPSAQVGSLMNGVGYSSSDGGSFVFDGVNDYIDMGSNIVLQPIVAGTYNIWFKVATFGAGALLSNLNSNLGYPGVEIWQDSGGLRGAVGTISSFHQFFGTTGIQNIWRMVTIAFDGANVKGYVNGVEISSVNHSLTFARSGLRTLIGQQEPSPYPLKGNVGSAFIYDGKQSGTDILDNFNRTKTRYGI